MRVLIKTSYKQLKFILALEVKKLSPVLLTIKLRELSVFDNFLNLANFSFFDFWNLDNFISFDNFLDLTNFLINHYCKSLSNDKYLLDLIW